MCLLFFALSFSGNAVSSETHFASKGILLPNNVVCLFTRYGGPESQMRKKKQKQQHVTTVIINTKRRENKPKDRPEVRKGRRFYRLVSCRAGDLHRCTWRGSPLCSPRTAHPASPWSWTLESCFPIFQRTLPQSLCPLLSLFSVKHIYGMTSQVYPSCEPSAPFFGSG